MSVVVPEDIRSYDEDQFLRGPDVDDIFAKDFQTIFSDAVRFGSLAHLRGGRRPDGGYHLKTPSDIDPALSYASFDGNTLLLDQNGEVIGGFIETDLGLEREWRGQGLGTEIVVEHFMRQGSLPTWSLDVPAYSNRGHDTCVSASAYPVTNGQRYFLKAARMIILENDELFEECDAVGDLEAASESLAADLRQTAPGGFEQAASGWFERQRVELPRTP